MNRILAAGLIAVTTVAGSFAAFAQDSSWPTRPIRILVGAPPGGLTDILARRIQDPLSAALGQPVTVENKPGAGGLIATTEMANSTDNHTISIIVSTHASSPALLPKMPFDPIKDVSPVVLLGRIPLAIAVNPSVKVTTLQELVAAAKAGPAKLNYGTPGNGLAQHFAGELLKLSAKIDMTHVPYRGAAPVINDLVGGQIQVGIVSPASIIPMMEAKRVNVIAVTGKKRLPRMPGVPTIAESGYPEFDVNEWYGVAAPATMPAPIVARINAEIVKIFATPERQAWLAEMTMQDGFGTPQDFADFVKAEIGRLGQIAKAANIRNE